MTEGDIGLLVLGGICLICSIVVHWFIGSFWVATLISVIAIVVLFQVVAYLQLGYLDAFSIIAVVTTSGVALVASAIIGAVVRHFHRPNESQKVHT
jgi:hypothetical protein